MPMNEGRDGGLILKLKSSTTKFNAVSAVYNMSLMFLDAIGSMIKEQKNTPAWRPQPNPFKPHAFPFPATRKASAWIHSLYPL